LAWLGLQARPLQALVIQSQTMSSEDCEADGYASCVHS